MRRSLTFRLSAALAALVVLGGLLAALLSYLQAHGEAEELQDDTLRQVAALVAAGAGDADPAPDGLEPGDPELRVWVYRLDGPQRPAWLPAHLASGFHTLSTPAPLRLFVRHGARGAFAVAQSLAARGEIEEHSALWAFVPMLLLLPVFVLLVVLVVRSHLASVAQLAVAVEGRSAAHPEPLPEAGVSPELHGFVRALNRLLVRINALLGDQQRFIASAAHELRNPLGALVLQAQNVQNAPTLAIAQERLAPLMHGIQRARRLTGQLLSHARAQVVVDAQHRLDLAAMVRAVAAELRPFADARDIALALDADHDVIVGGSEEACHAIVANALDNAIRYSPAGATVCVSVRASDGVACVEVTDTGPGLSEFERERAFAPFHRSAGATGEGTGLGLAIARSAAQRLGGEVDLIPGRAGRGLVFRYRQKQALPAAPA